MKRNIGAFVFARGSSKGLPHKNILPLAGKPLIAYAIDTAKASAYVDRVFVSTDDERIADIARAHGAEVPFLRPQEFARDDTPERRAWQHAIATLKSVEKDYELDVFVCVPTTAPLRSVADLDACIEAYLEGGADIVISVKPASRNPYYNMVTIGEDGRAELVMRPDSSLHARQASPDVYDMTAVAYVARPDYVLATDYIFDGTVRAVVVPEERGIDIDSELDLHIAEFLLGRMGTADPSADKGQA